MQPWTLTKVSPLVFQDLGAIFATNPITLQMRVQAKAKSKPALRFRSIKTKASWRFGKAHLPTQNKNNVLLASSNHGETIYTQHVWVSFRRITGDTNDIAIARHTSTVRDVLRSTPLLDTIQSAHAYQQKSTEKPEPINMGPDFFLDAGGKDGSDDEIGKC